MTLHRTHSVEADDFGPDELELPHLEARLWAELRREHARPSSARRRRIRRSLGAAAVAAAVAAGVVVVATTLAPVAPTDERAGTPGGPANGDAVDLEAQVIGAIDEALATSIVHTMQDNATFGDDEAWFDESTGARRFLQTYEDGTPSYDSGMAVAPGLDDPPVEVPEDPTDPEWPTQLHRSVDYCFGEYAEVEVGALPAGSEAARIRDGLADGSLVVEEGTQVIDGRELLSVVRIAPPPSDGPTWSQESVPEEGEPSNDTAETAPVAAPPEPDIRTYIDPETYRPVMVRGYVGSDAEYTQTIGYLPRTPETLTLLVPPVPDGFVEVAELRGDGERFDAGCGF